MVAALGGLARRLGRACLRSACSRRWASTTTTTATKPSHPANPSPSPSPDHITLLGTAYPRDRWTNVSPSIQAKLGRGLLTVPNHPLRIIKLRIEQYLNETRPGTDPLLAPRAFAIVDSLSPVVTVQQNFDSLLVPADHVSRQPRDTYYVNQNQVLRCHTSAHQVQTLREGHDAVLIAGDVFRRDEIDASHYPAFHQMEGIRLFSHDTLAKYNPEIAGSPIFEQAGSPTYGETAAKQKSHTALAAAVVERDLKATLDGLARHLFGSEIQVRWVDAYFPFTHPSWEMEVLFHGKWLEVLGCGVVQQQILSNAGVENKLGWAFGLGLERLAMVLFGIPDIRLFWSTDSRFVSQFSEAAALNPGANAVKFQEFSRFLSRSKDTTFWLPSSGFEDNDFFELVRSIASDLVENVQMIDSFVHPKTGRTSKCFRVTYRSYERDLSHEEVNLLHNEIRNRLAADLKVELR
ncbi:phenylalanyl-tRNA synthetase [Capsaspora owczarzaki ATCC 30864]|uniref:phenylalanine--tRNA ligase n=1 Tax=Capsaspora owczarzaki (strain ATCC 30864) TaxID=595528 RepID=A0A0D2X0H1_CAPO3|nr:phenylalanyl-tRNA synthetase [Capsaspora owczarzaki ATCC 30864]KJE89049.1 phenylalanyl-tRNA synthetase [Capsaspora owczarzaki ATCC 30864]|eukprot:XP_004365478.1 phenylalanyl-tRNA synthetase [Capsaspora owczarzaki ATCC 30864]